MQSGDFHRNVSLNRMALLLIVIYVGECNVIFGFCDYVMLEVSTGNFFLVISLVIEFCICVLFFL